MGNCIELQKPILWVDDDYDDADDMEAAAESPAYRRAAKPKAAEVIPTSAAGCKERATAVASTEIKIKMSKKQLQELLRQVEEQGLPLQKLMADLLVVQEICLENRDVTKDAHWRPNLQSIPE
ncbi:uncharacterized protein LOC122003590 [Zingiber officinale]|uniref:Uncharacterized protein n=1 Tax=Zingiber officinale TaxID=94328 RepID=A0A8J5M9G1_ZINOF|nr:uncharacterized protein LOC122003590 [Zingiber officinale]KAG6537495.1 hypothetical protein ZIOFF_002589 [Zingiber officinale]